MAVSQPKTVLIAPRDRHRPEAGQHERVSARAEKTLANAAVPAVDLASLVIGGTKDLVCGTFTGRSHSSAPGVTDAGWDGSAAANTVRADPMRSRIRGTTKGSENGQQ